MRPVKGALHPAGWSGPRVTDWLALSHGHTARRGAGRGSGFLAPPTKQPRDEARRLFLGSRRCDRRQGRKCGSRRGPVEHADGRSRDVAFDDYLFLGSLRKRECLDRFRRNGGVDGLDCRRGDLRRRRLLGEARQRPVGGGGFFVGFGNSRVPPGRLLVEQREHRSGFCGRRACRWFVRRERGDVSRWLDLAQLSLYELELVRRQGHLGGDLIGDGPRDRGRIVIRASAVACAGSILGRLVIRQIDCWPGCLGGVGRRFGGSFREDGRPGGELGLRLENR